MEGATVDFDRMQAEAAELARRMVETHGIAAPFAVVVLPDGKVRKILADSAEREPRLVDLVRGLVVAIRWQAASGRRAHQMWRVEMCPCRIDFSRRAWAEMRRIGRSTSMRRLA